MKTPPTIAPLSPDSFDSFDQALIDELRRVVVAPDMTPARASRRRRPALAAASIAAVATTALGLSTLGATSAYAVERTQAGAIRISIHRLADAAGLEEELASYGIDADVNYAAPTSVSTIEPMPVPGGSAPDGLTFTDQAPGIGSADTSGAVVGGYQQNSPCGDPARPPMTAVLTADEYVITIPSGSPLDRSDSVLKISTSGAVVNSVAGIVVSYTVDGQQCGFGSVSAGDTPAP